MTTDRKSLTAMSIEERSELLIEELVAAGIPQSEIDAIDLWRDNEWGGGVHIPDVDIRGLLDSDGAAIIGGLDRHGNDYRFPSARAAAQAIAEAWNQAESSE